MEEENSKKEVIENESKEEKIVTNENTENTEEGLINLNTCEEKDFDRFKYLGLTDTSIKTIVKYSKNNGFTRKEELLEIGIKENVYNKIKEYIIL